MTDDESPRQEPPAPDGDGRTEPATPPEQTPPEQPTVPPVQATPEQPTPELATPEQPQPEQAPPGWAAPSGPPTAPQTWPAPPAWGSPGETTGWAQPAPTQPMAAGQPPTQPMAAGQPPTPPAGSAVPPWGAPPPTEPPPWAGGGPVPAWGTPAPPRPSSGGRTTAIVAAVLIAVLVLGAGVVIAAVALFARVEDGIAEAPQSTPTAVPQDPDQPDPGPLPSEPVLPSRTLGTDEAREYVSRANEYCRAVTDPALKKAFPLYPTDPETFLRQAASANRDLTDFLRKDVPDEISDPVGQVVEDWESLSDNYERAAEAVADGDLDAATRYLDAGEAANAEGNAVATSIGMSDCAQAGALGEDSEPSPSITA